MDDFPTLLPPSAFQASAGSSMGKKSIPVSSLVAHSGYQQLQPLKSGCSYYTTCHLTPSVSAPNFGGGISPPVQQLFVPATQHVSQARVQELTLEYQQRERNLKAELHVLEQQLQSRSTAFRAQIEKLETELDQAREAQRKCALEKGMEIEALEVQVKEKSNQIDKLKCYIAEQSTPSTNICKKQLDNLQQKVQTLEKEKRDLESSIELLNIRLKSQDHIQSIAETAVSQLSDATPEKKKQVLLKRWRTKVYELLVQLQSSDLVHRKDQQIYKQKVLDLTTSLEEQKQDAAKYQHALEERQATLGIQIQHSRKLEAELQSAENLALELVTRNKTMHVAVCTLVEFAERLQKDYQVKEEEYIKTCRTLQQFGQRIAFASGRVELIQIHCLTHHNPSHNPSNPSLPGKGGSLGSALGRVELIQNQLARKDALKRVDNKEKPAEPETVQPTPSNDFQEELSRLMRERDCLAKQGKEDVLTLERKLQDATQSYEVQIAELKQQNENLLEHLHEKAAELSAAQDLVDTTRAKKGVVENSMTELQQKLERMQNNIEQEVLAAYDRDKESHRQELADLRQKLNDANREHSKTVVSLRQLERQMGREKERMTSDLKTQEQSYKQRITVLEKSVRELEKERNLLMTTLRQEGLVGKHRAARASPITSFEADDLQVEERATHYADVTRNSSQVVTAEDESLLRPNNEDFDEMQHTDERLSRETEDVMRMVDGSNLTGSDGSTHNPAETNAYGAEEKDTYFEDPTEESCKQMDEDDLAGVMEEVKKLSEEVMEDSYPDSEHSDASD